MKNVTLKRALGLFLILAVVSLLGAATYKILVRRGLKADLPTLTTGEFGFTTDTKELYIGSNKGNIRVHGDYITPEMYGAKGNGTTDDTAAVQAAANAAATSGVPLAFTGKATYKITSTLTIRCDTLDFGATLNVDGNPATALIIGGPTGGTTYEAVYWGWRDGHRVFVPKLVNLDKPATGWTGCGTGVLVRNAFESEFHFNWVYGFNIGLRVYGINDDAEQGATLGGGSSHNQFYMGHIEDCKIALQLDAGANGFVNENNFYGGRYSIQSAEGSEIAGTRYFQIGVSTKFGPNNNVFYKPSLEGDGPACHAEFYGSLNQIISGRWEVTAVLPKVHFGAVGASASNGNTIRDGYAAAFTVTNDTGTYGNNISNREGNTLETATSARGTLTLANAYGDSAPALVVTDATTRPWGDHTTDYRVQVSAGGAKFKPTAKGYPMVMIDGDSGAVKLADGDRTPTAGIYKYVEDSFYAKLCAAIGFYEAPDTYLDNRSLYFDNAAHRLKVKDASGGLFYLPLQTGDTGVTLQFHHQADALADDGTVALPDATSGMVLVSCNGEAGMWLVQADGTCTKIAGSANTANTDSDTDLCVYDGGSGGVVKNRLGVSGEIRVVYYYN